MNKFKTNIVLSLVILVFSNQALADLKTNAVKVLNHRIAMKVPTTTFGKWQADQWTFSALECLSKANKDSGGVLFKSEFDIINKFPIYLPGSFGSTGDVELRCKDLAENGLKPACYGLGSYSNGFTFPWPGMRSNYLYLEKGKEFKTGDTVIVGGECQLVINKPSTKQYFAGESKIKWLSPVKLTSLNTPKGLMNVKIGTVTFEIEGLPEYFYPQMVLVP